MKEKYIINNIHNEKKKKKIKYINYKKFLLNDWKYKIKLFPKEIQRKLCIYTWRAYWRDYVPLIAKPPSWLSYHNFVQKSLWEARQKNIHFLHLPFNTLPENKKWIMGCQCDFCINDNTIDPIVKHMHYLTQYRNNNYFNEVFIPSGNSSNWNEYIYPINDNDDTQYMKIFDPLCGSYKENKFTKRLREGYKFEFSYPI
jgi:hypothetical protein